MHWMNATQRRTPRASWRKGDVWCQRILAPSALWDATDPAAWWNHPSTKIPTATSKMPAHAGTSSTGRTTPGCALGVPPGSEKFAWRSLGGGGMATQNPFLQGICPHQKEDSRFSTLTHCSPATTWAWEVPPWVTQWFFTLCRAFKWPVKNSYRILIAKLCTYTKPALAWFGGKLSARMTF